MTDPFTCEYPNPVGNHFIISPSNKGLFCEINSTKPLFRNVEIGVSQFQPPEGEDTLIAWGTVTINTWLNEGLVPNSFFYYDITTALPGFIFVMNLTRWTSVESVTGFLKGVLNPKCSELYNPIGNKFTVEPIPGIPFCRVVNGLKT